MPKRVLDEDDACSNVADGTLTDEDNSVVAADAPVDHVIEVEGPVDPQEPVYGPVADVVVGGPADPAVEDPVVAQGPADPAAEQGPADPAGPAVCGVAVEGPADPTVDDPMAVEGPADPEAEGAVVEGPDVLVHGPAEIAPGGPSWFSPPTLLPADDDAAESDGSAYGMQPAPDPHLPGESSNPVQGDAVLDGSQVPPRAVTGCSKCRYATNGCGVCHADWGKKKEDDKKQALKNKKAKMKQENLKKQLKKKQALQKENVKKRAAAKKEKAKAKKRPSAAAALDPDAGLNSDDEPQPGIPCPSLAGGLLVGFVDVPAEDPAEADESGAPAVPTTGERAPNPDEVDFAG